MQNFFKFPDGLFQRALTTLGRSYYIYALDLNGETDRQTKLEYAGNLMMINLLKVKEIV
jgi:hypothetical protein